MLAIGAVCKPRPRLSHHAAHVQRHRLLRHMSVLWKDVLQHSAWNGIRRYSQQLRHDSGQANGAFGFYRYAHFN